MKKLIFLILGMAFIASCNNSGSIKPLNDNTIPDLSTEQGSATSATTHKAVVLETLDAGTYTYLRLEADGEEFWAAVTARPVEVGKSYYYTESILMKDFESKQLQRTFESILFIDYFGEQPKEAATAASLGSAAEHTSTGRKDDIKITPAEDGISLEELFGNKDKYNGKEVLVRGEVVKISRNIMSLNWIHIQDGTSYEGQYDLTVTVKNRIDDLEVNDIVSFKGTITLEKDFGAGYFYPVIMENASLMVRVE